METLHRGIMFVVRKYRVTDSFRIRCPKEFEDEVEAYKLNRKLSENTLVTCTYNGEPLFIAAILECENHLVLSIVPSLDLISGKGLRFSLTKIKEFLSLSPKPCIAGVDLLTFEFDKRARFLEYLGFSQRRVDENFMGTGNPQAVFIKD